MTIFKTFLNFHKNELYNVSHLYQYFINVNLNSMALKE